MLQRFMFLGFFFIVLGANSQKLEQIRSQYPSAEASEEVNSELDNQLSDVSEKQPVLLAYKGAVQTLKAKFAKKAKEKKAFFKTGVELIETALKSHPDNIELHYIRLTVQENAPRVVGYHGNIEEDRDFILQNFSAITSESLRSVIENFVASSKNFDDAERAQLQP